jgi:hypothetical protein
LQPNLYALGKRRCIGTNAKDREYLWSVTLDSFREMFGAEAKFIFGEFVRTRGGTRDDIRDTKTQLQKLSILIRSVETVGKTRAKERLPKSITWTSKVMPDGTRIQARVDSTKKHIEIWGNDVCDDLSRGSRELLFGWSY